jgi:oligoendopeptidase F
MDEGCSELEAVISEDACWRQIKMTCDTGKIKHSKNSFTYFMMELHPKIQPWSDKLNRKLMASPFIRETGPIKYFTYLRDV